MAGFLDSISNDNQTPSPVDVFFSMLDSTNIAQKTDLNMSQIKHLFRLRWYTEVLKEENRNKDPYVIFQSCLDYFMVLMCSLKRKSRDEIVDMFKSIKDSLNDQISLANPLQKNNQIR